MPFLYNWRLWNFGSYIVAEGLVTAHINSACYNGREIRTNAIAKAEVAEGALRLTTRSGSVYGLMPEAIDPDRDLGLGAAYCLARFGVGADFVEDCLRAREAADARDREEEPKLVGPGELLLVTVGVAVLRALFRAKDGTVAAIRPFPPAGYPQSSYRVTDRDGGTVDLEYLNHFDRMVPCRLSHGVETIKIKNLGGVSILFGAEGNEVRCPAGQVTAIPTAGLSFAKPCDPRLRWKKEEEHHGNG